MKTKGKRPEGIVFTNADPIHDMQGNWMIRKEVTQQC